MLTVHVLWNMIATLSDVFSAILVAVGMYTVMLQLAHIPTICTYVLLSLEPCFDPKGTCNTTETSFNRFSMQNRP